MDNIVIRPQSGPQTAILATSADIAIFGGAAGGGKTWSLLMEPLRHMHNPEFSAVFFRRTYPQITNPGGMWDESEKLYTLAGAEPRASNLEWVFPSGARVKFAHLQHEKNKRDWQGAQIPLIGFDELTHFSETQFFYMLSRNRSLCGVRPYVRATTNPDADSWVARFIGWWLDKDTGYPIPKRAGVLRYFVRDGDTIIWGDSYKELAQGYASKLRRASGGLLGDGIEAVRSLISSVTFIPSKVTDNQALLDSDPGYLAKLLSLPLLERERLLGGNWKIRAAGGKVFNRGWFEVVDAVPVGGVDVIFWDFAATARKVAGDDPDYTAAVYLRYVNGMWYILDCQAVRVNAAEIERLFVNRTKQAATSALSAGARFMARWEVEPGSAAKREAVRFTRMLAGMDARGIPARGDKLTRAMPVAAQAEVGNIKLLRGAWNERFLRHLHNQPDWPHDDIMDALSGAFDTTTRLTASLYAGKA